MQASLACDPSLRQVMTEDFWGSMGGGNQTIQDQFCDTRCGNDLETYRSTVKQACAGDPQPLPGYPATYWGDSASAAWNQICLKDSQTGAYCVDVLTTFFSGSTTDSDGTDLPTDQLCSNCVVSLFRAIQSTPYSNYDDTLAAVWTSIQTTCGLSFPVDVPLLETNVTTPGGFASPGSGRSRLCLSGNTYNVVPGDNCQVIAEKSNVATGTLIAVNSLYRDCSNLLRGATICLPPSCTTYKVQAGDTCDGVARQALVTFQQLVAWNPALDNYCTNLRSGENICVSPPGGHQSLTTIPGATVTQTAVYGTTTVARPVPVASGTTRSCSKYYQVQSGDYCQLIALNNAITLGLFIAINPEVDSSCTNLLTGFYYCVQPTENWNQTATSTVVNPPASTPPGTTASCYEYYTVQSGDYCDKITNMYSITIGQLQFWNPDLKADCSNLLLGVAYCVNGAEQPPANIVTPFENDPVARVKRTATGATAAMMPKMTGAVMEGGVPYGWPGLKARGFQDSAVNVVAAVAPDEHHHDNINDLPGDNEENHHYRHQHHHNHHHHHGHGNH
ncbi:hypothetical protein EPUS_05338 [Endocarpon pusillum Z07020]|uniref:LysM domain-containing protein n=1 Tax=Endocarpon pusillum (strain Z07020 / HMAS-L-300199) TaxID=1263415 RepID=U1HTJ1_ENDPU|nr:uncharacterized protein EPUS_05338 [Endocarpon pusillum Z07020]ERF73915.1 hypothetical protein EPUS_05338 [Endocarpon pusillum Z07020]